MTTEAGKAPPAERYWSAKQWSLRSGIPYKAILAAAARGELAALRPSRSARGAILISEPSWRAWLEGSRMKTRVSRPLQSGSQELSALAIGGRR